MRPARREGALSGLRDLLPLLIAVVLVLLGSLPLGLPGYAAVGPDLALLSVFYWTIHRPDLFSTGSAFLLGLLVDVLSGGPFGANALVLAAAQMLTQSQRPALAGKSFGVTWLGLVGIAATATVMLWLVTALWNLALLDPTPALLRLGFSTLAFPLYALAVDEVQRRLLPQA